MWTENKEKSMEECDERLVTTSHNSKEYFIIDQWLIAQASASLAMWEVTGIVGTIFHRSTSSFFAVPFPVLTAEDLSESELVE